MAEKMRILIGYDGSVSANGMLDDLRLAGLPSVAEVEVVTVAETWFPLPASLGGVETGFAHESITGVEDAKSLARHAHHYLKTIFPGWELTYAAAFGSPTAILLGQAENWQPGLIVVGAHGQTGLGGLLLGNVAQKLAAEAHGSVRVARGRARATAGPPRLLIGIDGSPGAEAAVTAVAGRHWPEGTAVRLVNAIWNLPLRDGAGADRTGVDEVERHETMTLQIAEWVAHENARIAEMIRRARERLTARGLVVTETVRDDDPKRLLLTEAREMDADTIFLGARGRGRLERLLLGSVSSTIVQRAPCSVEIVRG